VRLTPKAWELAGILIYYSPLSHGGHIVPGDQKSFVLPRRASQSKPWSEAKRGKTKLFWSLGTIWPPCDKGELTKCNIHFDRSLLGIPLPLFSFIGILLWTSFSWYKFSKTRSLCYERFLLGGQGTSKPSAPQWNTTAGRNVETKLQSALGKMRKKVWQINLHKKIKTCEDIAMIQGNLPCQAQRKILKDVTELCSWSPYWIL